MFKLIAFVVLGIVFIIIGIVNFRGILSTINRHNRRKVSGDNIIKYGRCMGIGTIVMGISLLLTALLEFILQNENVEYIILGGFAVGLALMIFAQFKYNRGIF